MTSMQYKMQHISSEEAGDYYRQNTTVTSQYLINHKHQSNWYVICHLLVKTLAKYPCLSFLLLNFILENEL